MMKKIEKKKEVQKILLSLLLSKRGPTLLNNLDHEYFQSEEEYIPWKKLGHVNLVAFLKSMPESFLLEKSNSSYLVYGIPSDKSKHVSSLVSRQKIPKRVTSIRSRPRTIHNFLHTQNHSIRIPAEKLNWLMQYIKEHPLGISIFHVIQELRKMLPYMKLTAEDLQQQLCEMNHQLYMDGNIIYAQKDTLASSENTSGFSHSLINWAEVKDNDSELLKKKCTSEDLDDFWDPTTYENPKVIYDVPSKYDNDEYESVSKSYDIGNDAFSADQDLSGLINDKVQLRLKNLMEKYPNGITCADLPELYLKEYKVSLNYEKLGFSSVRAYVSYLPHIFYMKQPNIKDDFILYSADKRPIDQEKTALSEIKTDDLSNYHCSSVKSEENSDNVDYNEDDENVPFPNDLPPNVCEIFRPENAMFDEDIGYISVTDLQNSKKAYLEVYIVDVFTPSFFWIQLRKGKNRLQKLMNDLNVHYDKHKKMYHIPRLGLKRGLHCVCLFSNVWHRAIIKTVKPDYKVTVMFYDYGTLKMYLPEEVYYLDKSFTRLPAQAIACSLYNVQPCVGDRWKKSITHRFIDKIADTILAATIVSVDASNNSMSVILTDTSEEEDVHINNWLVQENLARKGKMDKDGVDMSNIMNYVLNKYDEMPAYCYAEENLVIEKNKFPYQHDSFPASFGCFGRFEQDFKSESTSINSNIENSTPDITLLKNLGAMNDTLFQNEDLSKNPSADIACSKQEQEFFNCIAQEYKQKIKDIVDTFINNLVKDPPRTKNVLNFHCWILQQFQTNLQNFVETMNNYSIIKYLKLASVPNKSDMSSTLNVSNTSNVLNVPNTPVSSTNTPNTPNISNVPSVSNGLSEYIKPSTSSTHSVFNMPSATSIFSIPTMSNSPNTSTVKPPPGFNFSNGYNLPRAPSEIPNMPDVPKMFNITNNVSCISTMASMNTAPIMSTAVNVPNVTSMPNLFNIPNIPSVFSMPNVYSMPNIPIVHSTPSTFGFPQMPNQPSRPSRANMHNVHNISSVPNMFNVPRMPNIPNISNMFRMPNVPQPNNMPRMPNMPQVVSIPSWTLNSPLVMNTPGNQYRPYQFEYHNKHTDFSFHNSKNCDPTILTAPSHNDSQFSHNVNASRHKDYKDMNKLDENLTLDVKDNISNPFKSMYNSKNEFFKNDAQCEAKDTVKRVETNPFISPQINVTAPMMESNCTSSNNTPDFLWRDIYCPSTSSQNNTFQKENNINSNPCVVSSSVSTVKNDSYFMQNDNTHMPLSSQTPREESNQQNAKETKLYEEQKCNDKSTIQTPNTVNSINEPFTFYNCDNIEGVTLIFSWQSKGWILTREFVKAFGNFLTNAHFITLIHKLFSKHKEIYRSDFPDKFVELDRIHSIDSNRDSKNCIISITLISIKDAMDVLHTAGIISPHDIQNLFKKNLNVRTPAVLKLLELFHAYYKYVNDVYKF